MAYQKIIEICHKINEEIRESNDYKMYKHYENLCILNDTALFEEYKKNQENYLQYKDVLNKESVNNLKKVFLDSKQKMFEVENIKLYFEYKQKVEKKIGEINFLISKSLAQNVKYLNEIGLLVGGKNCG